MDAAPAQPVFFYDLGSPDCYLLGERVMGELPVVPEWEPVLGAQLGLVEPAPDPDRLARAIAEQGLQPLRLPTRWPPDTERAMLAATFAKRIGRAVAFSLAAFRQAFAGGRDLGDDGTVLIAAAACEMHPTALLKGNRVAVGHRRVCAAPESAPAPPASTRCPRSQWEMRCSAGERALDGATAALMALR